jgi:mannosyltransferase OCH1-like enzyme
MIPKIIHYCWYGGSNFSKEIILCMQSWKKYCPDYEIKCWNEENSPMQIPWIKETYKYQKFAFVADYMRFYALYHEGGIYLDTDMLLISPIDDFLNCKFFAGLQDAFSAGFGIIGSEKGVIFNQICLNYYDSHSFNMVKPFIITHVVTSLLKEQGFVEKDEKQILKNEIVLYPSEIFYPIHYTQEFELSELKKYCSNNTLGVHLWNKSWISEFSLLEEKKYKEGFKMVFRRLRRTPFLPFAYYKKFLKYLFRFIFRIKK